jgi:hypothetical protein
MCISRSTIATPIICINCVYREHYITNLFTNGRRKLKVMRINYVYKYKVIPNNKLKYFVEGYTYKLYVYILHRLKSYCTIIS